MRSRLALSLRGDLPDVVDKFEAVGTRSHTYLHITVIPVRALPRCPGRVLQLRGLPILVVGQPCGSVVSSERVATSLPIAEMVPIRGGGRRCSTRSTIAGQFV